MEGKGSKVLFDVEWIPNRIEHAKPSYLEIIKEEKNKQLYPSPEPAPEEPTAKLDPPSGIPNTVMIRKSKRKFLVVSMKPIYRDEEGKLVNVEESDNGHEDSTAITTKEDTDMHTVSTKK